MWSCILGNAGLWEKMNEEMYYALQCWVYEMRCVRDEVCEMRWRLSEGRVKWVWKWRVVAWNVFCTDHVYRENPLFRQIAMFNIAILRNYQGVTWSHQITSGFQMFKGNMWLKRKDWNQKAPETDSASLTSRDFKILRTNKDGDVIVMRNKGKARL